MAEKPLRLVVKESAFNSDTAKVNVQQLLKQLSPYTELRVI
jgi:adenine-specific DNA-methyltransferase